MGRPTALESLTLPGFEGESIRVSRDGHAAVIRNLSGPGGPGEPGSTRGRIIYRSQYLKYGTLLSASRVDGHRRYELTIDMREAGLSVGVPFSFSARIEGDPLRDADGKFRKRTYLGQTESFPEPLWLRIDP